ncbi:myeloid zinc finger 1-like [Pollicipes pollicipes]|uniref:myeloid zinc finger 1-like n=1 Tax=Pollicipes pollicipes TaxID=41117 RepID=UPI001884B74E|nr:myeloid zinc finger 1-like [Pollicipes pollicipes]
MTSRSAGEHACGVCGQRYRTYRSMVSHTKVHEGLTMCPLCGRVSNNVPDLRKHLAQVHKLTAEQVLQIVPDRFSCATCGQVYRTPGSLSNHQDKHRGLTSCPLCGKVVSIVPSLRKHLRNVHQLSPDQILRLVPSRK